MIRTTCFLLIALPLCGADKPVTLKDDELAVLADPESPDRWKLLERYEGKIIQIDGRVSYKSGSSKFVDPKAGYYIILPKKKPTDEAIVIYSIEWSDDPSMRKVKDEITNKADDDRDKRREKKPVATPGMAMTIYGRLAKGDFIWKDRVLVVDVAADPKIGGIPYRTKAKEPARLKDK